ncbi:MAG: FtsW/RodA/SpoVE family cell cycle protein, partial [Bacteroidota bacterium]
VGEEQGFIGSFAIICLFMLLILRIIRLGERNKNAFVRHYAYGIAGLLFIHFFVNIGMTMGLVPVVGIPLPFISKGGSALISFSVMFAVLIRMDSARF